MSEAVRLIELFPESGAPHALDTRRLRLSPFPYSLVYRVIGDRIEIIAVAHDRQQSGYWRGR